jgi:hypothetical protein
LITKDGWSSERLWGSAARQLSLRQCKTLIQECYADLLMIRFLGLEPKDYFMIYLESLVELFEEKVRAEDLNADYLREDMKPKADEIAIRCVSAILQTEFGIGKSFNERLNKYVPQKLMEVIKEVDKEVAQEKKKPTIDQMNKNPVAYDNDNHERKKPKDIRRSDFSMYEAAWNFSKAAIERFIKIDAYQEYNEWVYVWRCMAPYLYATGKKVEDRLQEINNGAANNKNCTPDSFLPAQIRNRYAEVKAGKDGWEQLSVLMKRSEDA